MQRETPEPTERIGFRRYRPDDVARVVDIFADGQARRFYPHMATTAEARRWIDWNLDNYAAHGFGLWVIERRHGGEFLGDCGLTYQTVEQERLLEIGYHVVEARRGLGYATEAARACLEYAFETLKAPLVCSIVDPANMSSNVVASRIHVHQRQFTKDDKTTRRLYWTERD